MVFHLIPFSVFVCYLPFDKYSRLLKSNLSLVLNIGCVSNETNADVRMYIEEFILVEIWIHYCTT